MAKICKRLTLALAFYFLTIGVITAQETGNHEIRVGAGDALPVTLGHSIANSFIDGIIASLGNYTLEDNNSEFTLPMFTAGYRYNITDRIKIGLDVGYLRINGDLRVTHNDTGEKSIIKQTTNYYAVLPSGQVSYYKKGIVNLYGSVNAGVIFGNSKRNSETTTTTAFAYQVNPIGIRVGKQWGGYAELGYGYKGFANIGMSYTF